MVRASRVLVLLALAASAMAQEEPKSLFQTQRPDGTVVVREHSSGAEVVEITMLDSKYPVELLQKQAQAICQYAGSPARGLQVYRYQMVKDDPNLVFARATFALDALIDAQTDVFHLEPILRAFAGAPEPHQIRGLGIIFEGQAPNKNTVMRFKSDAVEVEAAPVSGKIGVEYRVRLLSQDPDAIHIPDRPNDTAPVKATPPSAPPTDRWGIVLGILAALSGGALVYFLTLRIRPSGGSAPRR